jgi:hypothetical protein
MEGAEVNAGNFEVSVEVDTQTGTSGIAKTNELTQGE